MTPEQVLSTYFGYHAFRTGQLEIVQAILTHRDTLAILPTGGGKSICFQVPGLIFNGTTLVISPLISLMKDQVETLLSKGISATYINSSLTQAEQNHKLIRFKQGKYKFVYLSPEKLLSETILGISQKVRLPFIVIDEAHCISEWGQEFRPEYQLITNFVKQLPQQPTVAAFTATATQTTKRDIIKQLQLSTPYIYAQTFARDNLVFSVIPTQPTTHDLIMLQLIKQHAQQSGIIYTATRTHTEQVAKLIRNFFPNLKIAAYHAGLENSKRSQIQEHFIKGKLQLISATSAFGMGVDKPDVRFVIHYHPCLSIEEYYQEAGRGGRDGQTAYCYLLNNKNTFDIVKSLIDPDLKTAKFSQLRFSKMKQYAAEKICRKQLLLSYFKELTKPCGECDNCQKSNGQPKQMYQSAKYSYFLLRKKLASAYCQNSLTIASDEMLAYLALLQPIQESDFLKVPGIGLGWLDRWYNTFSCLKPKLNQPHSPLMN